ncbi:MAG TPA: polyphosphate polymerase domain-containing protein [Thermoleophilaceae bacterium]|nr:polyphosphate polymerase domain-containing protein [Thermoleophilaceae bacterium]
MDHKYLLAWEHFAELASPLGDSHDALEIDGSRLFSYSSVYFDTPDLLCFREHVEGRVPRFKVRSRAYHESGVCSFEVKVKVDEDETAKQNLDYELSDHGQITPEARRFLEKVIADATGHAAPEELRPALTTRFRRGTLGARDGSDRITIDFDLRLERPDGAATCLSPDHVVVETKSEEGDGRLDRIMRDQGRAPISLSKYRLGIGSLAAHDPDPPLAAERDRYIQPC